MIRLITAFLFMFYTPDTGLAGTADDLSVRYQSRFDWRDGGDVIAGWDWSLPPWVSVAENAWINYTGASTDYEFPGNRLVSVDVTWNELEPIEDQYEFSVLQNLIDSAAASLDPGDKIQVFIRQSVWEMHDYVADTNNPPVYPDNWDAQKENTASVPRWMENYPWFSTAMFEPITNISTPFQLENADIYVEEFHQRYLDFVAALWSSGVLDRSEIGPIMIKERSATRGEEHDYPDPGSDDYVKWLERINAWVTAAGSNSWKLVYGGTEEPWMADAIALGTGTRSGFAEMYLLRVDNEGLGQSVDSNNYLCAEETAPVISENRMSGDDNEEYVVGVHEGRFGPVEYWPHRYHESMLRILQMRRNYLSRCAGDMNPELMSYVSLSLGKTMEQTPDVWCSLQENYANLNPRGVPSDPIKIKNFERWLHQRDFVGYTPLAAEKVEWPLPSDTNALPYQIGHHPDHQYDYTARKTQLSSGNSGIAFDVNDAWLPGGPHPVWIKVTYTDRGTGRLKLQYYNDDLGTYPVRTVDCTDSRNIKTVSWRIDDMYFSNKWAEWGKKMDFKLVAEGEDVAINFVRIVRADTVLFLNNKDALSSGENSRLGGGLLLNPNWTGTWTQWELVPVGPSCNYYYIENVQKRDNGQDCRLYADSDGETVDLVPQSWAGGYVQWKLVRIGSGFYLDNVGAISNASECRLQSSSGGVGLSADSIEDASVQWRLNWAN